MTSTLWSISLTIGSYPFEYHFLWPLHLSLCSNRMTHIDYTTRDPCPSSLVESLKQIPLPVRCSYTQSFLRNHLGKYILFSSFQQWGTTSCLKKYFQISVASLNFRMGNQLTFLQLLNSTFLRRKHVLIFGCQNCSLPKGYTRQWV